MSPTCPICKKAPMAQAYRPFCSRRCADLDLQRWFSGGYAIPDSVDEASTDESRED